MTPIPASKCTSRSHCPCDFCVRVRVEIAEGRSEKDEQNKIAEDFLRSYSQSKPAWENSSKLPATIYSPVCAVERKRFASVVVRLPTDSEIF
jgi:hypothetical protein